MKIKALFSVSGAIALIVAASYTIPSLTTKALAESARMGGWGTKLEQLNLTDEQKGKIQQIYESTHQQIEAVLTPQQQEQMRQAREQRQRPNLNLTQEQKTKIEAIKQNAQTQMQAVLTAEQQQKFQQLRQQWHQRHQQQ